MNSIKTLLFFLIIILPLNASVSAVDYLIGAGDVIEVSVFQQPDMKAIKTVSATGEISFPLAGLVKVVGKTEHQAEQQISTALARSRVINNPEVAVRIVEYRSATVSVDGLVARPGEFPVLGYLTFHQLISKAGGLNENANPIITVHRSGVAPRKIDLLQIYSQTANSQDYSVKPGDRILVEAQSAPAVFYTYGAVEKNGRYELVEGMTVMQALALSGGRTEAATKTKVKIFRESNNQGDSSIAIDASEEDIVQPNDVIRIEESRF